MRDLKIVKFIFALAIAGVLIAGYSLYLHYAPEGSSGGCAVTDVFNCDMVNKSIYSDIFGIPVALLGVLFYLFLSLISFNLLRDKIQTLFLSEKALIYASGFGVLYSLSLGAFVFWKLGVLCPVCMASYLVIILIFILSFFVSKKDQ